MTHPSFSPEWLSWYHILCQSLDVDHPRKCELLQKAALCHQDRSWSSWQLESVCRKLLQVHPQWGHGTYNLVCTTSFNFYQLTMLFWNILYPFLFSSYLYLNDILIIYYIYNICILTLSIVYILIQSCFLIARSSNFSILILIYLLNCQLFF